MRQFLKVTVNVKNTEKALLLQGVTMRKSANYNVEINRLPWSFLPRNDGIIRRLPQLCLLRNDGGFDEQ